MGHRLIDVMIKNNVPVLYINDNAYVSAETVKNNSLIASMVSGAEAFAYDYLARYCVKNAKADKEFAGKYVVRYVYGDKQGAESVYSA